MDFSTDGMSNDNSPAKQSALNDITNNRAKPKDTKRAELEARATEEQQLRYQTIMRQLEILGVRNPKIAQLHQQLQDALGDDSGRKLAVLHQAIKKLVHSISFPELREAPTREISFTQPTSPDKRQVIEYSSASGHGKWLKTDQRPDEKQGPHRRPWRADQQELMWKGEYNKAQHVIENLFVGQRGRPMLSAAVGVPKPDYIGDLVLEQGDNLIETAVKVKENEDKDEEDRMSDDLPMVSRDRIPGADMSINHLDQVRRMCACLPVCVCVCMLCVCISVYLCVCVFIRCYLRKRTPIHTHTHTHTHRYTPMRARMYGLYACMHACM
jgi:hypothetical protein